jgi:hypothetical protein
MSRVALMAVILFAVRSAYAQRPALQRVDEPKSEQITETPQHPQTQVIPDDRTESRFSVTAAGRQISIEQDKDAMFLTASIADKTLWTVEFRPTAEPADPQFATIKGWNFLLVRFSRVGMFLYDLTTGKPVRDRGSGWDITASPDGKWGILEPYYSRAWECYVSPSFLRIAPDGKATMIETIPLSLEQLCTPDRSEHAEVDAVVSPNGRFYAIVPASKTFSATGVEADGIVELFRASDNRKLASIRTKFPPHFSGIAFSTSNNYLVLKDSPETGHRDETQWFRIRP